MSKARIANPNHCGDNKFDKYASSSQCSQ